MNKIVADGFSVAAKRHCHGDVWRTRVREKRRQLSRQQTRVRGKNHGRSILASSKQQNPRERRIHARTRLADPNAGVVKLLVGLVFSVRVTDLRLKVALFLLSKNSTITPTPTPKGKTERFGVRSCDGIEMKTVTNNNKNREGRRATQNTVHMLASSRAHTRHHWKGAHISNRSCVGDMRL